MSASEPTKTGDGTPDEPAGEMSLQAEAEQSAELLPIWTATVEKAGRDRAWAWRVAIRASDADTARGALELRGHNVVSVEAGWSGLRRSTQRVIPSTKCTVCEYDLRRLPRRQTGDVTCPECGTVNMAFVDTPRDGKPVDIDFTMSRLASKALAWLIGILVVAVVVALIVL